MAKTEGMNRNRRRLSYTICYFHWILPSKHRQHEFFGSSNFKTKQNGFFFQSMNFKFFSEESILAVITRRDLFVGNIRIVFFSVHWKCSQRSLRSGDRSGVHFLASLFVHPQNQQFLANQLKRFARHQSHFWWKAFIRRLWVVSYESQVRRSSSDQPVDKQFA